ncbi:hypothetical protein ACQYWQ_13775 [Streptomyces sp. P6-2-1]|uniref:hypothetical protein n=1 Tax=Streptomyces sp. P6-2-1 TaxID=3422591 RepID=UPI003D35DF9F
MAREARVEEIIPSSWSTPVATVARACAWCSFAEPKILYGPADGQRLPGQAR